jgi:hypothetical protein
MQLSSLKTEIKGYQKIISHQQTKIKEEVSKREKIEQVFGASKLNNEQTILNQI